MPTKIHRKRGGTRKRHSGKSSSLDAFQKEITLVFLEMPMMV